MDDRTGDEQQPPSGEFAVRRQIFFRVSNQKFPGIIFVPGSFQVSFFYLEVSRYHFSTWKFPGISIQPGNFQVYFLCLEISRYNFSTWKFPGISFLPNFSTWKFPSIIFLPESFSIHFLLGSSNLVLQNEYSKKNPLFYHYF